MEISSQQQVDIHKRYIEATYPFVFNISKIFSESETQNLRAYGAWMDALEREILIPTTDKQRHFVEAAAGRCSTSTMFEYIWCKYKRLEYFYINTANNIELGLYNALYRKVFCTAFPCNNAGLISEIFLEEAALLKKSLSSEELIVFNGSLQQSFLRMSDEMSKDIALHNSMVSLRISMRAKGLHTNKFDNYLESIEKFDSSSAASLRRKYYTVLNSFETYNCYLMHKANNSLIEDVLQYFLKASYAIDYPEDELNFARSALGSIQRQAVPLEKKIVSDVLFCECRGQVFTCDKCGGSGFIFPA